MTWDRVEKLLGSKNLKTLSEKRVGVVGLGSGGGFVAQSLAMSGVGYFVLIDNDVIETGNVVRHVADLRSVGQNKAHAVAELIRQRNPNAHITVHQGKVEEHLDALDDLDLLVVGVDGEPAKYVINEACLKRKLSAVYAGVYERGEGGDVVLIQPYDGPCYACWSAELRDEVAITKNEETQVLDYGMIGENGTLEAEPGLWLHVVRIASAQADIALNELLRETEIYKAMPGNTVIMANTALEIIAGEMSLPYTSIWATIERNPHCLVCGDGQNAFVVPDMLTVTHEHNLPKDSTEISLDDLMNATGIIVEDQETSHNQEG